RAFFFVEVNDRLGIAARSIAMAAGFEAGTQRGMVVDFAVEGDPHAAIFVGHRLLACRAHVDNREPPMCETDITVDEHTAAVRTAVAQDVAHPAQPLEIYLVSGIEVNDARQSA